MAFFLRAHFGANASLSIFPGKNAVFLLTSPFTGCAHPRQARDADDYVRRYSFQLFQTPKARASIGRNYRQFRMALWFLNRFFQVVKISLKQ
ncbi:hypothetical protein FHR59_003423 [Xanthomonas arboricola]|uniref:hypothetical protein n=1 Tax=Xanthomonas TaxID=338 RepID=UPI001617B3EB|nr:hypothetical protein [Xanthomonas arboricola]MBB6339133.1 hypothetical protein [Xanthomonas arboricola]